MKKRTTGFTLIELMIIVTVIGILAVIAIPKFGSLLNRAQEADTRASLGALRSALSIYYSDNQIIPETLTNTLDAGQHYIAAIPSVRIAKATTYSNPGHALISGETQTLDDMATAAWIYIPVNSDSYQLSVNCSHLDSRGVAWSAN